MKQRRRDHSKNRLSQQKVTVAVTSLFLLLCCGGFVRFIPQFYGALLTHPRNFTQTRGRITSSQLVLQPGGKTAASWNYRITYTYQVAGVIYSSNLMNFDWVQSSRDHTVAQRLVASYPVGLEISVFYLPSHPAFAVLDPQQKGTTISFFIGLILITLCCLKAWLHALRSLRRSPF